MSKKVYVMLVASCANLFSAGSFCYANENASTDDVVIMSREQFLELQKKMDELQKSIDSLANKSGNVGDSQLRSLILDISSFLLLLLVCGCFYVVYDYLFRFRKEKGHENQTFVGYLMSLVKTKGGGTLLDIFDGMNFLLNKDGSIVENILDQIVLSEDKEAGKKTTAKDLLSNIYQIWAKMEPILESMEPMLRSMGDRKIIDFILDNWEVELNEELVKEIKKEEEINQKQNILEKEKDADGKSVGSKDTDISVKDLAQGRKITLRKLLGYPKLIEMILKNQKIGDNTLLQLLNPLLELLRNNSLNAILNFKIKTKENEEKTVKELFVEPAMTVMSVLSVNDKINNADLENMKKLKERNASFVTKCGAKVKSYLNNFDKEYEEFKGFVFGENGEYFKKKEMLYNLSNITVKYRTCRKKLSSIIGVYKNNFNENDLSGKLLPGVLDLFEYIEAITKDEAFVKAAKEVQSSLKGLSYIGTMVGSFRSYDVMLALRPNNNFSLYNLLQSRLKELEETMKVVNSIIGSSKNSEDIKDVFMEKNLLFN